MRTPLFIVDAFTRERFRGNPAGVCLLEDPADPAWMQSLAAELGFAETAFLVPRGDVFDLRWFTPAVEVDLCGHATLASAHVLWETERLSRETPARFDTRSGRLIASLAGDVIELDFPALPGTPSELPVGVPAALGCSPLEVLRGRDDFLVLLGSERELRALTPDFPALRSVPARGIIVTAKSDSPEFDFVSRFFAPGAGIDEDPVTGSAHCMLSVYWSEKLGRPRLRGWQASKRGGAVHVELRGDRVALGGHAVTVVRGELA